LLAAGARKDRRESKVRAHYRHANRKHITPQAARTGRERNK
jgi:hypothetical protein